MAGRRFDRPTLDLLDHAGEIEIVTRRPDGRALSTIIWVMVDGDEAFVRSVRGDRGRWFQAALDRPAEVELMVDSLRLRVRVVLATDDLSVARCSSAIERKYASDPDAASMVREEVLGTTLRVEPR